MSYIDTQTKALKIVKRVALTTLFANIALVLLKGIFGVFFNNMALISDALHSAADSVTTLLVVIAAVVSKPQSDKEHNYGHEKRESFLLLLFALFVLGLSAYIIVAGIIGLINPGDSGLNVWLIIVVLISIIAKALMFQFTNHFAKKTKSASLKADGWGHLIDCITSFAVLIGLIAGHFTQNDVVENIAVLLVAVFLVRLAVKVFIGAYHQLTDKTASKSDIAALTETAWSVDGVKSIDKLATRLFGSAILVDLEIGVDSTLSLIEAHDIAETVHNRLEAMTEVSIKHCNVHVNPYKNRSV